MTKYYLNLIVRFFLWHLSIYITEKMSANWPGAHMISCFLDLKRRKVKSLVGSISRIQLRPFVHRFCIEAASCTVVGASRVLLMGMPATMFVNACNKRFLQNFLQKELLIGSYGTEVYKIMVRNQVPS